MVLIDLLNGKRDRDKLLKKILQEGNLLACCSVNVTEVYSGMLPKEEQRTQLLLDHLEYFPVTRKIAKQAGLLKRDWAKRGKTLSVSDVTIAAVALEHKLILMTDNVKHYPMSELKLYKMPKK